MSYAYKHFTFLRLWHSLFSSTSLLFSKYWHSFPQEIGIFSAELSNLKLQLMCTKWCHAAIKGDISLHKRLTFFFNWKKKNNSSKKEWENFTDYFFKVEDSFLLCFLDSWKADTFFWSNVQNWLECSELDKKIHISVKSKRIFRRAKNFVCSEQFVFFFFILKRLDVMVLSLMIKGFPQIQIQIQNT